jgi:hypothetical protein
MRRYSRQGTREFFLTLFLLLMAPAIYAHHSAPAFFDVRGFTSVSGVISGSRLENPHSYYRVTAEDGTHWAWESGPSWTALAKLGWTRETLPEGTRVRMSGIPALADKPIARFDTIVVFSEDGGAEIYGLPPRNTPWAAWVIDEGTPCASGIEDCRRISDTQLMQLQQQFGNIGIWSEPE